jgi:hypothetical protein
LSSERDIRPSFSSGTPLLFSLFELKTGAERKDAADVRNTVPELAGRVEPGGGGTELLVGEAGAVVVEPSNSFGEITICATSHSRTRCAYVSFSSS